ncbi:MAG: hypothetical protein ACRC62_38900 [Microcoleus sp.]
MEESLPDPNDDTGFAPPPESRPPILPAIAPPTAGTALIPPGYQPEDQARPPVQLFWAGRYTMKVQGNQCQPTSQLAFGLPRTPATDPNPYSLENARTQQPSTACPGVRRQGFARNGQYLGDLFDVEGPIEWVKVPESARN